jgi:hypothetical protein
MSNYDQTNAPNYFNNINENNNILGDQYLETINKEMNPLVELSKEITDKVHLINNLNNMNEGFDNNNSNIGNNFLKFIIFIIIIIIIFTIIYNICK